MAELESYLTLSDAARKYGIPTKALTRLVRDGIIRAVRVNGGMIAVAEESVKGFPDVPSPSDEMKGHGIRATEALKKYRIASHSTLSGWRERGIVTVIEQEHKNVTYDEYTVAVAAQMYHATKKKQGVRYPKPTSS